MKTFKKNNKIQVFFFFILLLNISCKKVTEYEVLSGQLIGYVNIFDRENEISDYSGIEIVVEDKDVQIKALTNEDGLYTIDNLKSGIYNITFNKDGLCPHKIVSYQFLGGNNPAKVDKTTLYKMPDFQFENIEFNTNEFPWYVSVTAEVSPPAFSSSSYYRYYLSNTPDLSHINYISTNINTVFDSEEIRFNYQIDTIKFPAGSDFYMIIYPASEMFNYYTDINTGKSIYTSINIHNPSEVVKITVPEKD